MLNPNNRMDFKQLVDAANESDRKLMPFREKRKALVSLFCGSEYSDDGEAKKVYLNLLSLATNIYVRQCAVRAPTARVTSPYVELRPTAANLSLACREAARECKLGLTLRRAVTEAMFSPLATVKVGLQRTGEKDVNGQNVDVTEPFVKLVSFDDYVRDMSARSAYEPAFEGNTYYLSREELEEKYPKAKRLKLTADDLGMQSTYGDERTESISHSPGSGEDNWRQRVAVRDLWLKKERLLVTYVKSRPDFPIGVIELDSPEEGPFHSLWFTDVPDNAMPLPPFSVLKNIQELANSMFRRLAHQAQIQKRVVGFSDEESANRFKNVKDGDGLLWTGQKPENIQVGGIDPKDLALLIQLKDMFSWAAGNLDSLGGLSPMAETAKQDEMLAKSASAQLADMQDAAAGFAHQVFRQITWYEWTDPVRERILEKEIQGTDVVIPARWSRATRQGDFLDFNFYINPQSMRENSPAAKIQKLNGILTQFYQPLMPFFQQQGLTVDIRGLNQMIADYANLPELEQLIISLDPNVGADTEGPVGNPNPVGKASNTTRTYERVNRPGATRVGKDMALMQTLMGGNVQPAESEAMFRSVS